MGAALSLLECWASRGSSKQPQAVTESTWAPVYLLSLMVGQFLQVIDCPKPQSCDN